jgi:serine phosphatase RsbU (regulator of sigma subunit)/anti-sigma regulatory factor (Ser/Thr protein kinase)/transposase
MKLPRKWVEWVLWAASLRAHRRVYKLEVKSSDKELLTIKDFVVRVCDAGKCAPRETANVKLAMDEASTNVIRHAYDGKTDGMIEIEGSVGPYDVTFKIRDRGKPFDFRKIKDPDLNHYVEIGRKGGLGVWLIKKVMSRVDYKSSKGVNELTMVRYFDVAPMFSTKADTRATARMRTIPVSAKFTLGAVLMVVIFVVSAYGILSVKRREMLKTEKHEKIVAVLNAVSLEAGESVAKRNDLDLNNLLQKITLADSGQLFSYASIVSADGRYLANNDLSKIFQVWVPPKGLKPLAGTSIQSQSIDHVTHYGVPILWQGHEVGQIWLGLDEKALNRIVEKSISDLRTLLGWGLALSVIAIWMLSLIITRPIQKIFAGVRALHSGDLTSKIMLDSQDEFGELASIFNEMTAKLQASQNGMVEQERLQKEMQVAQEIQHTLLPASFPDVDGYEIGALYRAAKEVGGDYYDFFWVDPTVIGIVVADVSGKGVPGSLVMTMIRTAMRLEARGNKSAADVLSRVNQHVTADMKKGMFVTMFYVVLDSRRRTINFASAGHNPMILYRGRTKEIYFLKPKGFPLGISLPDGEMFERTLAIQKISLEKNDMLVIYTDGITEAMNKQKKQFGEDRLIATIRENAHLTPEEFVGELSRRIAAFTDGAEQNDDITVVAIKEKLSAETVMYKTRRKLLDLVEKKGLTVTEACRRMNVPTSQYYQLKKNMAVDGESALRQMKKTGRIALNELSNVEKKAVLAIVGEHPEYGPTRIAEHLKKAQEGAMVVDHKLVYQYLKRKGLSTEGKRKALPKAGIDSV